MYDILDLYQQPYNPSKPVIGIDEKPKQLLKDSRKPLLMQPGKTLKEDYEYVRSGTANIFMAVEPKHGRRITKVTKHRTRKDFARYMKEIVLSYPSAKKIRVVIDNLNTHFPKSFYETFEHEEAERILNKLEFHYTPKHASWLNVAEIEIGIMDTECTRRRIPDIDKLRCVVRAWNKRRNKQRRKIVWTFTRQKADQKLGKHYTK